MTSSLAGYSINRKPNEMYIVYKVKQRSHSNSIEDMLTIRDIATFLEEIIIIVTKYPIFHQKKKINKNFIFLFTPRIFFMNETTNIVNTPNLQVKKKYQNINKPL